VLANGDLGWVQISTFLATGGLMLAYAIGARQMITTGPGRRWIPRLLGIQGIGLIIAGLFRMDPADGFPIGTPAGMPATMSTTANVHNMAGTVTFLAMIITCFVLARRFAGAWAALGRVCGALFVAGLLWCYSGGPAGSLTLFLGVVTAWSWLSGTAAHLAHASERN
jgi:hypothetical protein